MMEWSYFYYKYSELSDSKLKSYISLLEDIDSGDELVNVVTDIKNEEAKELLVRKAIKLNVELTQDDCYLLDGEISSDLYVMLAREVNIVFGTGEEVAEVLECICDEAALDALYVRAVNSGVKFTQEQLESIGKYEDDPAAEKVNASNTGCGCLLAMLGGGLLFGSRLISERLRTKHNGRCDGNCASCPPHYGYRYGRWYYGHAHQHGCVLGGNGGASGKCSRD